MSAFSVQADWLFVTFGEQFGTVITEAILSDKQIVGKYVRPGIVLQGLAERSAPDFEQNFQDASRLFWSALNCNGIESTISDGRATMDHAGAWFCAFGTRLGEASIDLDS